MDITFEEISLTGSEFWVAARLGRPHDWFVKFEHRLYRAGFPPRDPLIRQWIKSDVDSWINLRRSITDEPTIEVGQGRTIHEI